jgi:hypothetical protein|tara:strand:- start:1700 stop:2278 length:579 start_codon:yes stop_codon:yes gene_type:complete
MKHYEIYNNIKLFCLVGILSIFTFSCEDSRIEEEPQENIQMWVNGDIIPVYDYYESITTYGVKTITDSGDIKKVFVIHFQKSLGRISPEKEHYALIFYDIDGDDDNDLIDLGVYINPDSASSKGITLEITGLSDYTTNAQGVINVNNKNIVSGVAEGTFWNPYREEFQNGLIVFDNLEVGTDPENTFYSEYY